MTGLEFATWADLGLSIALAVGAVIAFGGLLVVAVLVAGRRSS